MNPDLYCQQKAAPPGSSNYYALRQAKPPSRPCLTALYALKRELEDTVLLISDPHVAKAKLAWWQTELAKLPDLALPDLDSESIAQSPAKPVAHQVAHPVAKVLQREMLDFAKSKKPGSTHSLPFNASDLIDLVQAYADDLEQSRYLDDAALHGYLLGVGGNFAGLVARIAEARGPRRASLAAAGMAHADAENSTGWAESLGIGLSLAELVESVGDNARHGRIYVPVNTMQAFEVSAADIINRKYSNGFVSMMEALASQARNRISAALAALPMPQRSAQTTLRAQAALSLKTLDEVASMNFQVLHQRIALTPLRKLWVSWRAV